MNARKCRLFGRGAVILISSLTGRIACGESGTAAPDQEPSLEEIVVTATKHSETLQDVPMSITALTGAALTARGVSSFADVATSVPSLSFRSSGPGRQKLTLRGLSAAAGAAPTVSFYLDEIPFAAISSLASSSFQQAALDPRIFDLERIEVLRGPQGTLYGSSSLGGTIRLITRAPVLDELSLDSRLTASQTRNGGTNYSGDSVINLPVIDGLAALRVVASYADSDGYVDRRVGNFLPPSQTTTRPPNSQREASGPVVNHSAVNAEHTTALRASLLIEPGEAIYLRPFLNYQRSTQAGRASFDEIPGVPDSLSQRRRTDVREPFEDEYIIGGLTAGWDADLFSIVSASAYTERKIRQTDDISDVIDDLFGGQPGSFPAHDATRLEDFTQEIRVTSAPNAAISWIVGGFYKNYRSRGEYAVDRGALPFEIYTQNGATEFTEFAVFGEATAPLTQRLKLTLGARKFWNETFLRKEVAGAAAGDLVELGLNRPTGTLEEQGLNPKATLAFDATEDVTLHVGAAKGSRPGGISSPVPPDRCAADFQRYGLSAPPRNYATDSVWSYELGMKSELLDRRMTFNASAYWIEWSDVQLSLSFPSCGFSTTTNGGNARSRGVEIETAMQMSERLRADIGAGYNSAELTSAALGTGLAAGQELLDAPNWTLSAAAEYVVPFGNEREAYFKTNWSYLSESLDSFSEQSGFSPSKPGYTLGSARVGVRFNSWSVSLYADNITDTHAVLTRGDTLGQLIPIYRRTVTNRPRTVGISIEAQLR